MDKIGIGLVISLVILSTILPSATATPPQIRQYEYDEATSAVEHRLFFIGIIDDYETGSDEWGPYTKFSIIRGMSIDHIIVDGETTHFECQFFKDGWVMLWYWSHFCGVLRPHIICGYFWDNPGECL